MPSPTRKARPSSPFRRPKSLVAKSKETPPKVKCCHCMGSGFEPDQSAIGKTMRAARMKAGRKAKDIATAVGVSQSYLSELETGKKKWTIELKKKFQEAIAGEPATA